ncbi:hypothetical protein MTO96_042186, partial [Rhipicephalus appendiculatus]
VGEAKCGGSGEASAKPTTVTTGTTQAHEKETDSSGSSSPLTKRLAYNTDIWDKWHQPWVRFSNCVLLALLLSTLVLVIVYAFIIRRSYPITVAVPVDFLVTEQSVKINDTDEASTSHTKQRAEDSEETPATVTSAKPRLLPLDDPNEDLKLDANSEETTELARTEW